MNASFKLKVAESFGSQQINGATKLIKIVINDRHGGFGLSDKAVRRYAELKGITLYPEKEKYHDLMGYLYWTVPKEERSGILTGEEFHTASLGERGRSNEEYRRCTLHPREIPRDDPDLVKVVQELGSEANGKFSKLKIVEIPDGVNWYIEEYDGLEHIAEVHRTWS